MTWQKCLELVVDMTTTIFCPFKKKKAKWIDIYDKAENLDIFSWSSPYFISCFLDNKKYPTASKTTKENEHIIKIDTYINTI